MPEGKRKSSESDSKKRKRYRSDGTPVWEKRRIDGPGVWVTCVKGKEKQAVGEICEVFGSTASKLWPKTELGKDDDDPEDDNLNIEDQIAKEVSSLKCPQTDRLFANCQTNTQCVIFISCKPPVDPVELVVSYVKDVKETGVTRTRYIYRLVPVSDTTVANLLEIETLCRKVFAVFFNKHLNTKYTYKIELRVRNHTTIPRETFIQTVAKCLPEGHSVDLDSPQLFILVEVFKSICGISVVEDYYRWHKFNIMEIAKEDKEVGSADALSGAYSNEKRVIGTEDRVFTKTLVV